MIYVVYPYCLAMLDLSVNVILGRDCRGWALDLTIKIPVSATSLA